MADIKTPTALTLSFFVGGADAEMRRIVQVLREEGAEFCDKGLGWGAKASQYAEEITATAAAGRTPVLIELTLDCEVLEGTIVVDHHNERAGEPASILQVLDLLGRAPTRWDEVVAANDAGWFPGLQAIGATPEEIARVRAFDREAQGITPTHEAEAERALAAPKEWLRDIRIVRMSHSKATTVGDRLAIAAIEAGTPTTAYLVLSGDGEVNFSGDGALAAALHTRFQGWSGGSGLGKSGEKAFWGGYPPHEEVLAFIREYTA